MSQFTPTDYGPVFADLISGDRCRSIGEGNPDRSVRAALERATLAAAFAPTKVVDRDMAECCLAGVWLLHDFLDESHTISQSVDTTSGSFWHGIMHRREGDFWNAKYWFRRVGEHSVFEKLRTTAAGLAGLVGDPAAAFLREQAAWDPYRFIDLCEEARGSGTPTETLCRRVQLREWALLFDWCYKRAM